MSKGRVFIICGSCAREREVYETYEIAEKRGWVWTERDGWRGPLCEAQRKQPRRSTAPVQMEFISQ